MRNLSKFNRFLEVAAMTDGEMVVWNNIAKAVTLILRQ